ncbi:hypothetical protein CC80DRAFT_412351 [Byssothecium circinans]|uniref:Uncharacterized protein n=1 Tax=Byssothecium circinans TaxID=147558 RepID=A0A6A5TV49_9PLEO|nr:hypothetical protein CC80DRAFT_412351 [Byssothecium circinans]
MDPRAQNPFDSFEPDTRPNCAICDAPDHTRCSCESERLAIAVEQAEQLKFGRILSLTREWVVEHSRQQVIKSFRNLLKQTQQTRSMRLSLLPDLDAYSRYMSYGSSALPPSIVQELQSQISQAQVQPQQIIDETWHTSSMKYPAVLDYFYSLVEIKRPEDGDERLLHFTINDFEYRLPHQKAIFDPGAEQEFNDKPPDIDKPGMSKTLYSP